MFLGPLTGLVFEGPGIATTLVFMGAGDESWGGEFGWVEVS
jgi:hypothetical protein